MPVGAGSIKRAAKLNKDAGNTEQKKKDRGTAVAEGALEPVVLENTAEKTASENTASATKKAADKSTGSTKKESVRKEAAKKDITIKKTTDVCHLTEELPIYLL